VASKSTSIGHLKCSKCLINQESIWAVGFGQWVMPSIAF